MCCPARSKPVWYQYVYGDFNESCKNNLSPRRFRCWRAPSGHRADAALPDIADTGSASRRLDDDERVLATVAKTWGDVSQA
jgi:hypothetical protein